MKAEGFWTYITESQSPSGFQNPEDFLEDMRLPRRRKEIDDTVAQHTVDGTRSNGEWFRELRQDESYLRGRESLFDNIPTRFGNHIL